MFTITRSLSRRQTPAGPYVESKAGMADQGGPSGWLVEAGRSLGQPEACAGAECSLPSGAPAGPQGGAGLFSTLGRHASTLKAENEMLRRCLQDSRTPGAFESYLRASTTH